MHAWIKYTYCLVFFFFFSTKHGVEEMKETPDKVVALNLIQIWQSSLVKLKHEYLHDGTNNVLNK